MHRTQVTLDNDQYEALKKTAEQSGSSLPELVQEAVRLYLESQQLGRHQGLAAITGLASDTTASGREHDTYLYSGTSEP